MRPLVALLLIGCAPRTGTVLVEAGDWAVADDDPWGAPPCVADQAVEDDRVEIRTEGCGWLTLRATLRTGLRPGEALDGLLDHAPLTADTGAEAWLVLRVDDHDAFDRTVPIPHDADFLPIAWAPPAPIAADAPVWFHLENHGPNAYRLWPLRIAEP